MDELHRKMMSSGWQPSFIGEIPPGDPDTPAGVTTRDWWLYRNGGFLLIGVGALMILAAAVLANWLAIGCGAAFAGLALVLQRDREMVLAWRAVARDLAARMERMG